ncbi:RRXRR domain-containing protein [Methylococcus sp. EFPC2]|uniref:RRXRR domain-containing protein n=1 Tax=Methylococcus sp. EFPC2 TaxID=2812648 RepID=UPI0019671788|nr:RRXRR domain-containing protein [Methylococcus sp. EFPC2]
MTPSIRFRMSNVLVFGADGEALAPCHPARARQLLRKQRARVQSLQPYSIRLIPPTGNGKPDPGTTPVAPLYAEPGDDQATGVMS